MKKFKVRATYTFEGYWVVEADSRAEAREKVADNCGVSHLVVDRSSDALDWDFDMKPTKETVGNGKIISAKKVPEYKVLKLPFVKDPYIEYKNHAYYENPEGIVYSLCSLTVMQDMEARKISWEEIKDEPEDLLTCRRCKNIIDKGVYAR